MIAAERTKVLASVSATALPTAGQALCHGSRAWPPAHLLPYFIEDLQPLRNLHKQNAVWTSRTARSGCCVHRHWRPPLRAALRRHCAVRVAACHKHCAAAQSLSRRPEQAPSAGCAAWLQWASALRRWRV